MNCAKCNAPLTSYFKVEHVGRTGAVTTSATVCSLPCLFGWGQEFAVLAGMKIAAGARQKIDDVKRAFETVKNMLTGG